MEQRRQPPANGSAALPEKFEGLLFDWSGKGPVAAQIGLFVAISFAVHLFGFYLFQVVYPVSGRVEPVPSRIKILDPSQPSVSALMRQVDDRLVFLRPASSGSGVRVDLNDSTIPFRPSFSDRRIGFRIEPKETEIPPAIPPSDSPTDPTPAPPAP